MNEIVSNRYLFIEDSNAEVNETRIFILRRCAFYYKGKSHDRGA
jgi:hypothetical protein